jgi:hypothetical protein
VRAECRLHILEMLRDEVVLETAQALELLEQRMAEVLRERDRERSPTGEVRWHTAARAERKALMDQGLMVPAQPGIWELTAAGRRALE